MRITYLHQYFNTPVMSGGTRSYEMARRLVASGHHVTMITSDRTAGTSRGWRVSDEAGIEVHWTPIPYSNHLRYAKRVRAFLSFGLRAGLRASKIDADVIFATSTPLTIALPGAFSAHRQNVPMVLEVRDLWPEVPIAIGALENRLFRLLAVHLRDFAYRKASSIVALSPSMKDGVVGWGFPEAQVEMIPNGADVDVFQAVTGSEVRAVRDRFDWLRDRPMVIYAGTLGRVNDLSYLVDVASRTRQLNPEVRFVILGDGTERERIRQLASDRGIKDKNFFMIGPQPKLDMPKWLGAASVATSIVTRNEATWGNSANKFFDALAAGTPVAINYRGWQGDLLLEKGAGMVLDPDDPDAAASLLVRRLRDTAWLESASASALELAVTHFNRDALARQLEGVLLRTVEPLR